MRFLWADADAACVSNDCPVCGHGGPHAPVVTIPDAGPHGSDWQIIECADCHSRFSVDRRGADYRGDEAPDMAFVHYYLEQGAGLRPMLEPLAFAERGTGRMLEIGGGFGFPSDYVQTVLGWQAKCYDPSGMAVLGRQYLGLDITRDYWTADTPLSEAFDIAYASEVVEHIPSPGPFLAAMRHAVGDTGVVVLTTPDGAALNPGTTPGMLIPIASPGLHLTLFSAQGLERALKAVGFSHVRVEVHGTVLWAYAADRALPPPQVLEDGRYTQYLQRRIETPDLAPALSSGLKYRLLKELVNAGQFADALALFDDIAISEQSRFGIDIRQPETLTLPDRAGTDREWLAALPGNITGLLYFRAILANNVEGDARMAALFAGWAALLGASLRRALRSRGIEDGETELLCMASVRLHLMAAIGYGCNSAPLLAAIERGDEDGLILPTAFRKDIRRHVVDDLRTMGSADLLWQGLRPSQLEDVDEFTLLHRALIQGIPVWANAAFAAIERAADAAQVRAAFWSIWTTPGADEAPPTIAHARKLVLIRLVLLGAFTDARTLFAAWEDPSLAHDEAVATALGIAAGATTH